MNPALQPAMASAGAPLAIAAMRNAATVSAVTANDASAGSRAPADTATTQPTETAVLSDESPARTPPAAPMTTSMTNHKRGRPPANCQTSQAAAEIASAAAVVMPSAPEPKR